MNPLLSFISAGGPSFQPHRYRKPNRISSEKCLQNRHNSPVLMISNQIRPHVVVLPGMDGSGVLLEDFSAGLQEADPSRKVVKVQYPKTTHLNFDELRKFVVSDYLSAFSDDSRGYIVVCQSYSAHVGFRLNDGDVPGVLRGQVHVNGFTEPPGPRIFRGRGWLFPQILFEQPPPDWLAAQLLLGGDAPNMRTVQMAGAGVAASVMAARLQDVASPRIRGTDGRCPRLTPGDCTLFLCGAADPVVGASELAKKMRRARRDVGWVEVLHGPHLLLQRFGYRCAQAVDDYFDAVLAE